MAAALIAGACAFAGAALGAWVTVRRLSRDNPEISRVGLSPGGGPLVFRKPKEKRKPRLNHDEAAWRAEREKK